MANLYSLKLGNSKYLKGSRILTQINGNCMYDYSLCTFLARNSSKTWWTKPLGEKLVQTQGKNLLFL